MPPCMILKKMAVLCMLPEILQLPYIEKKEYDFHKCIYVTGASQSLHFSNGSKLLNLWDTGGQKNLSTFHLE